MPTVHFSQQSWTIITHISIYTYTYTCRIYIYIYMYRHFSPWQPYPHPEIHRNSPVYRNSVEAPKPIYEKVPIPTDPLPPKKVMVPVKVPGKRPPPIVHYKHRPEPAERSEDHGKNHGKKHENHGKTDGFLEKNMKTIGKTMKNVWKSYGTRERWWFRKGLRNSVVVMGIRLE